MLCGTVPLLTPCSKSHLESLTIDTRKPVVGGGPVCPADGPLSPGPIGGPMGARRYLSLTKCHPFVPTRSAPPLSRMLSTIPASLGSRAPIPRRLAQPACAAPSASVPLSNDGREREGSSVADAIENSSPCWLMSLRRS